METGYQQNAVSCGTTIMALEFKDGVVIAADSRTSCGKYVANRSADKLTRITDKIFCCRSGSASATQSLSDLVIDTMNSLEIQLGEPPYVKDAAVTFRNEIYNQRHKMIASVIVAGWDRYRGGQVFSIPISGFMIREPCSVSGSGSTYIQGYMAANFKLGMEREECIELAKTAVRLAIQHDSCSGGVVRIGVITKDGFEAEVFPGQEPEAVPLTNKMLWNLEFGKW